MSPGISDPWRRLATTSAPLAEDRRARRAALLAELAEARALRARVAPRRTRLAKTRDALRNRVFRYQPPPRRQP